MNRNDLWKSEAFQRWWDEDWSWDGLAKKFAREALAVDAKETKESLQDHWRHQESRLIEFANRRWTRFHLPPFDRNGQLCPERDWSNAKHAGIGNDLVDKIQRDSLQVLGAFHDSRREYYADLRGIFFTDALILPKGFFSAGDYSSAWFLEDCQFQSHEMISIFRRAIFINPVAFEGVELLRKGVFDETEFLSECRFVDVTFDDVASFDKAKFHGDTLLRGTFRDAANFENAEFTNAKVEASFKKKVSFDGVKAKSLSVLGAKCEEEASFTRVKATKLEFSNGEYLGKISLSKANLKQLFIVSAVFRNEADFTSCIVEEEVKLQQVRFEGAANFRECRLPKSSFQWSTWISLSDFSECEFLGAVRFTRARFENGGLFENVRFAGDADFSETIFKGEVRLVNARVDGRASFRDSQFDGPVRFTRAKFGLGADFSGLNPFERKAMFNGAYFCADADFSNREFKEETSFSEARFEGVPKFYGVHLHANTSFEKTSFHSGAAPTNPEWFSGAVTAESQKWRQKLAAWYRTAAYAIRWVPPLVSLRWPGMGQIRRSRDQATYEYETAYRTMSNLCAEIKAPRDRARFHMYEMRAQRSRTDVDLAARLIGWIYGGFSDYGQSIVRPIFALIFFWLVFAVIYCCFGSPPYSAVLPGTPALDCYFVRNPLEVESVLAATGRQFLPSLFGGATGIAQAPEWLRCAAADRPLTFFLIGFAQMLTFVGLTTLLVIATRRRFRLQE